MYRFTSCLYHNSFFLIQLTDNQEIETCIKEAQSRIELGKQTRVQINIINYLAIHYKIPYPRPVSDWLILSLVL